MKPEKIWALVQKKFDENTRKEKERSQKHWSQKTQLDCALREETH